MVNYSGGPTWPFTESSEALQQQCCKTVGRSAFDYHAQPLGRMRKMITVKHAKMGDVPWGFQVNRIDLFAEMGRASSRDMLIETAMAAIIRRLRRPYGGVPSSGMVQPFLPIKASPE